MSKQPPSNAFEVPLFGLQHHSFMDMHQCDACTMYSTSVICYKWPHNTTPAKVLPTKIRRPDVQLCTGCEVAYGATVRANGYVKKDSKNRI